MATATAGAVLGVNPFDEPDVGAAKEQTSALLVELADARAACPSGRRTRRTTASCS